MNSHLPLVGGRELVVHYLSRELKAAGHHVVVAGASDFRYSGDLGYPVWRWPSGKGIPYIPSRSVGLVLSQWIGRFDVVHAHSTFPMGHIATSLRGWLRTPVVITPHGEDINVIPEIGYGQRLDEAQDRLIKQAVLRADRVTAISDTIYGSLIDIGVQPQFIDKISNGVDLPRFDVPAVCPSELGLGFSPDAMIVTTVGNHRPLKGHEVLIDAVARLHTSHPRLRLVIIGRPDDALCRSVEARGLGEVVRFTGVIPPVAETNAAKDLQRDILKASTFYVSSSIGEGAEGLSLSLIEGMAAGLCPVVTEISGNKDVVRNGCNGRLVPPNDVDALSGVLAALADDAEQTRRLAAEAERNAAAYSWTGIAREYVACFERACQEEAGTP